MTTTHATCSHEPTKRARTLCRKAAIARPTFDHVTCDHCGAVHQAEFSHDGLHGEGPIFAVVCTVDQLTDYYTTEGVTFV